MQKIIGAPTGMFLYEYMRDDPRKYITDYDMPVPPLDRFNGRHFLVEENLIYVSIAGESHGVAKGLCLDGGTMRTVLSWAFVSTPFRDYLPAFMVHDVKCDQALTLKAKAYKAQKLGDESAFAMYTQDAYAVRKQGDDLLYEIMLFLVDQRRSPGESRWGRFKEWMKWQSGRREARRAWLAVRAYGKWNF